MSEDQDARMLWDEVKHVRAQLAAVEKERDRFKELLDAPPYVDCICCGCPRKVPQAWASGMCQPCANDDCEHTDGAKAVAEERDALAARVAQLERALEPTEENVRVIATALSMPNISPREQHRHHAERALAAIRARAGLGTKT